jgi:hypothetical protein
VQHPSRTKKVGKLPPLRSFSFLTLRQQLFILFIMALAETNLPGGLESAAKYFETMQPILVRQIEAYTRHLSAEEKPVKPPPTQEIRTLMDRSLMWTDRGGVATANGVERRLWDEYGRRITARAPYERKIQDLQTLLEIVSLSVETCRGQRNLPLV